jgi:hypothetical protein
LHSDPQNGLSGDTADLNQRRATFGRNELPLPALPLDTTSEEYAREKQYCELQEKIQSEQNLAVMRGGQSIQINVREIVVGDVLQVKSGKCLQLRIRAANARAGDLIPADGIVLQSNDLKLDESPVTGETDHIKKSPNTDPMLLAGEYTVPTITLLMLRHTCDRRQWQGAGDWRRRQLTDRHHSSVASDLQIRRMTRSSLT